MTVDAVEYAHRSFSLVVNTRSPPTDNCVDNFAAEEWNGRVLLDAPQFACHAECIPFEDPAEWRITEAPPTGRDAGGERAGAEVEETLRGLGYME